MVRRAFHFGGGLQHRVVDIALHMINMTKKRRFDGIQCFRFYHQEG